MRISELRSKYTELSAQGDKLALVQFLHELLSTIDMVDDYDEESFVCLFDVAESMAVSMGIKRVACTAQGHNFMAKWLDESVVNKTVDNCKLPLHILRYFLINHTEKMIGYKLINLDRTDDVNRLLRASIHMRANFVANCSPLSVNLLIGKIYQGLLDGDKVVDTWCNLYFDSLSDDISVNAESQEQFKKIQHWLTLMAIAGVEYSQRWLLKYPLQTAGLGHALDLMADAESVGFINHLVDRYLEEFCKVKPWCDYDVSRYERNDSAADVVIERLLADELCEEVTFPVLVSLAYKQGYEHLPLALKVFREKNAKEMPEILAKLVLIAVMLKDAKLLLSLDQFEHIVSSAFPESARIMLLCNPTDPDARRFYLACLDKKISEARSVDDDFEIEDMLKADPDLGKYLDKDRETLIRIRNMPMRSDAEIAARGEEILVVMRDEHVPTSLKHELLELVNDDIAHKNIIISPKFRALLQQLGGLRVDNAEPKLFIDMKKMQACDVVLGEGGSCADLLVMRDQINVRSAVIGAGDFCFDAGFLRISSKGVFGSLISELAQSLEAFGNNNLSGAKNVVWQDIISNVRGFPEADLDRPIASICRQHQVASYCSGWVGHEISLAFFEKNSKRYLVVQNKGDGVGSQPGIKLYQVGSEVLWNKPGEVRVILAGFREKAFLYSHDQTDFYIHSRLGLTEVAYIDRGYQKTGNCLMHAIFGQLLLQLLARRIQSLPTELGLNQADVELAYKSTDVVGVYKKMRNELRVESARRLVAMETGDGPLDLTPDQHRDVLEKVKRDTVGRQKPIEGKLRGKYGRLFASARLDPAFFAQKEKLDTLRKVAGICQRALQGYDKAAAAKLGGTPISITL